MNTLRCAVIFALVFTFAFGQLSDFLKEADKEEIKRAITSSKQSFLGLKTTYYSVSTLKKLNGVIPTTVCADVAKTNTVDIEDAFYSLAINDLLSCGNQGNTDKIKAALTSDSFKDLYYGISAALYARKQFSDSEISGAVEKLLKLAEEDGTFRSSAKADEGSVLNGGLALEVLARVANELKNEQTKTSLKDILKNAEDLFTSYKVEEDDLIQLADTSVKASNLRVTSTVFSGFVALSNELKTKVTLAKDAVVGFTEYLVKKKSIGSSEDAFYVVQGLNAAAKNSFAVPLAVTIPQASISPSKGEGVISIYVSNAIGENVPAKLLVLKAYPITTPEKVIITNQEISAEGGVYKLNFVAAKPEPGFYAVELKATPTEKGAAVAVNSVTRNIKVTSTVSVTDVQLVVSDSEDSQEAADSKKFTVEHPKSLEKAVPVEEFQYVTLTFKLKGQGGKSIQPQQVFVRIANEQREFVTIAKFTGKQYSAIFTPEEAKLALLGVNGAYELSLVVGDSFIQNSFTWKVATLNLKFSSRIAASESPFSVKPEITHIFRAPDVRATKSLSSLFTIASLAPLAILFIGLLVVGGNFSNFPFSGLNFIYALGFQGTLGAILALYGVYWVQLTMMETLKYLGVLFVPFLYFAMKTLNSLSISADKPKRE